MPAIPIATIAPKYGIKLNKPIINPSNTAYFTFNISKVIDVKIETIAGITSFSAISSYIERPLSYGNDIQTVIPTTAEPEKIKNALNFSDVAVLMKVYKNFNKIVDMLKKENMSKEAVLVSRCGLDGEKIINNIEAHKFEKINYLSTI